MSTEALVFDSLAPLVSGRVYPNTFPQPEENPVWPAIVYVIRQQSTNPDLCGADPDDAITVELEVAATQNVEVDALSASAKRILHNLGALIVESPQEDYEPVTRTHRERFAVVMP